MKTIWTDVSASSPNQADITENTNDVARISAPAPLRAATASAQTAPAESSFRHIEYSNALAQDGKAKVADEATSSDVASSDVLVYAPSLREVLDRPFSATSSQTLRLKLENANVTCLSCDAAQRENLTARDCVLLLDATSLSRGDANRFLNSHFGDGAAIILVDDAPATNDSALPQLFARLNHDEVLGDEKFAGEVIFHLVRSGLRHSALQRQVAELERERGLQSAHLHQLNLASDAFSGERDLNGLLQIILTYSRTITGASASALHLLESDAQGARFLRFEAAQGDFGAPQHELPLSASSLLAYVARTGETVCLSDTRQIPHDAPYSLDGVFSASDDAPSDVPARSLISVALRTHDGEIFGVLQLVKDIEENAMSDAPCPFGDDAVELTISLSRQVAVAMENSSLHGSVEELFDGFVTATARMLEQRDPATSGHSERVATLSTGLAQAVSETQSSPFADVFFSPVQIKELHYAALLHDFGKIVVHEDVLLKCNKLHPHELELLRMRFDLVRTLRERDLLQRKYDTLIATENVGDIERSYARFCEWDKVAQRETSELDKAMGAVTRANNPLSSWLDDNEFKAHRGILSRLCHMFFWDRKRCAWPLLTDHELRCLSVREGSLSVAERRDVERHVTHSFEFLKKIPWTRDYALIPQIAYCHHERCDGSGYPRGLKAEEIPLQSRIIAVCDTYDALTSTDRPYQRARSSEEALHILRAEADAGHLEPALVRLFIECGIWKTTLNWRKNKNLSVAQ